jgi:hypothetical protein
MTEGMSPTTKAKKAFLYGLIISVLISAVLGIVVILKGSGGWYEVRVFFTTIIISGTSICGLACGAYLERNERRLIPLAGIVLALLTAALLIYGIWFDPRVSSFWKTTMVILTLNLACAHLSLLSMARMAKRFSWAPRLSYAFVFALALMVIWVIIKDPHAQWVWKMLGVTGIGVASMTVLTPIFHWLSRHDVAATESASTSRLDLIDEEIAKLHARILDLEQQKQALRDESA